MAGRYDLRPRLPSDVAGHAADNPLAAKLVELLEALTAVAPAARLAAMAALKSA
jgi:hypothetical protein